MNLSKEFILIIVISVNVTTYSQENMGFFPGPLAYFGFPHGSLYNQKPGMMAARAIVKGAVHGTVSFYQPHSRSPVFITGKLTGLKAGRHNLFITEFGDSEQSCTNVGPIWDIHYSNTNYMNMNMNMNGWPFNKPLGDLGSVMYCNESTVDILNSHNFISLTPGHPANILGHGLVLATVSEDTNMSTIAACGPIFVAQPIQTDDNMDTTIKISSSQIASSNPSFKIVFLQNHVGKSVDKKKKMASKFAILTVLSVAAVTLVSAASPSFQERRAIVVLKGPGSVTGNVTFVQSNRAGPVTVIGMISGLTEGQHGFHVHEKGDISNGCISTGPHFNPQGKNHGGPKDESRHAGDLGNIQADNNGVAQFTYTDSMISLVGAHNILGRAVVVHADNDDLGRGGFTDSTSTGHAGSRVACGVIGILDPATPWDKSSGRRSSSSHALTFAAAVAAAAFTLAAGNF
ncbi:Superoxide dismutase, copper/zinc, binding site,Superoxide dismutase, copper/zinc binding domain [Cinara cedri]|uniref:Superoxide dismutase [Cu-Zn] n=1 Tax=Cinara cedri TaxID=506608 RepID=A0A5E4LX67_9HEMI|nr:Superoxide dismutase, copper/zinc, binding site,Superoxide dismutase, copper/zinc binding domain [Cinara cedri]